MNIYSIPDLALPLNDSWDVIVIGGGPAGCTAAIAAAREGSRTLLVEGTGCLGGMGTLGMVPAWTPFSDQQKMIYRGLAEKIFTASTSGLSHVPKGRLDWVPINPERLKLIYDREVTGAGVQILFHTHLAHVVVDAGRVDAVLLANKGGLSAYRAKVYVDATGDADLCAWAGAEFHKGNTEAKLMPATLCFELANVDDYAYAHGVDLHGSNADSPIYQIRASGRYPLIPDTHLCSCLVGPGVVGFNAGHVWLDGTNPQEVSDGMVLGRQMAESYRAALAEYHPAAFANSFVVNTASLMGVRETRRVVGDYELSLEDYRQRRDFPDEIARNCYYIDVHFAAQTLKQLEDHEKHVAMRYGPGESHGIPYRSLTPKTLKNVLVAGRTISCEQAVQGSVRVMPTCLATGEAAGLAAALSVANGDVHAVNTAVLRQRLRQYGAYLP